MKKKRLSEIILLLVVIGGTYLLIALDPSGNLFENIMSKAAYLLIGLFIVFGVVFLFVVAGIFRNSKVTHDRPHFFEEMQSMLQTNLSPLGFIESKGPMGRIRSIEYTKGNLLVKLDLDVMDSLYYLQAGNNLENGSFFKDFFLEGHISEADKFKSDSTARLNEWLIRNKFKERTTTAV